MDGNQRASKTHPSHWSILIDFLMEHPEMVTKAFVGLDGRQNYLNLWDEISLRLNSMGLGCKSTDKWIEAFTKWKSKVKLKAQSLKLAMNKTGGGGPLPPLTPIEEKLMGLIGWTAVDGDATPELGLMSKSNKTERKLAEDVQVPSTSGQISGRSVETALPPLTSFNRNDGAIISSVEPITSTPFKNLECNCKAKGKRQILPNTKTQKNDNITLLRMHQETMSVLQEINKNISRLADSQEASVKKNMPMSTNRFKFS